MGKRSALILEFVDDRRVATYKDLARFLGVSTMTVRRDCKELVQAGAVLKTIGGVLRATDEVLFDEKSTDERMSANNLEKGAIARTALELTKDASTVFIDGSTTGLALAKLINLKRRGLTVVTHSPLICLALVSGLNTVICAGGEFEPRSLCLIGSQAETFAKSVFIDIAFVSATGFLPAEGTFESAPASFRIKQEIARRAVELVLLADHTKFGRRALNKVFDLSQINHVVTDDRVSERDVAVLRAAGIDVNIAVPPRSARIHGK